MGPRISHTANPRSGRLRFVSRRIDDPGYAQKHKVALDDGLIERRVGVHVFAGHGQSAQSAFGHMDEGGFDPRPVLAGEAANPRPVQNISRAGEHRFGRPLDMGDIDLSDIDLGDWLSRPPVIFDFISSLTVDLTTGSSAEAWAVLRMDYWG